MTIRLPKLTIADKLLKALGKKRGVSIPRNIDQYSYHKALKENFWKALFRSKGEELPLGLIDIFDFPNLDSNFNENEQEDKHYK